MDLFVVLNELPIERKSNLVGVYTDLEKAQAGGLTFIRDQGVNGDPKWNQISGSWEWKPGVSNWLKIIPTKLSS